jgi:hypothetical protein
VLSLISDSCNAIVKHKCYESVHCPKDGAEKVEGDGKIGGYSDALARNIFPAILISNRAPLSSMNSLGFRSLSFPVAGS